MKNDIHIAQGITYGSRIAYIPDMNFNTLVAKSSRFVPIVDKRANLVTAGSQGVNEMAAKEPRGPGYQILH
jgi:hypothetical protein